MSGFDEKQGATEGPAYPSPLVLVSLLGKLHQPLSYMTIVTVDVGPPGGYCTVMIYGFQCH